MNRLFTNTIRYFLDECIPPVIRDSRMFMYPFFFVAYRGKNVRMAMEFKSLVADWSPQQYADYYRNLDTISRDRRTDLSEPCIRRILHSISTQTESLLDVGCGHGYLLERIRKTHPSVKLTGCDLKTPESNDSFNFLEGDLLDLSLSEQSYDVVVCSHTLEHLLQPERYVREMLRLARRMLIVVVPCQRAYYYTLDEHVNFFPYRESLTQLIGLKRFSCAKVFGDWVYIGEPAERPPD